MSSMLGSNLLDFDRFGCQAMDNLSPGSLDNKALNRSRVFRCANIVPRMID
ncbi:hypothetical protein MFFC18_18620 [Mariniblastus fucicola]|uniref:Uncharacterized protein n=1 Tax=Mariniblastus fucicola TaxID=980251 RepID=A0A5B9PGI0_9BACT|nr:hypothetical protein MFFC18_18620 [Mariniblastus fucicola]